MDIKLRARLSAYSKIESFNSVTSNGALVPDPDVGSANHVLGVNNSGNYTLFPRVQPEDIDALFTNLSEEETVTKEEIDTLFPDEEDAQAVTKTEIDSLFDKSIQSTTNLSNQEDKIGTVTYDEIDSLFK